MFRNPLQPYRPSRIWRRSSVLAGLLGLALSLVWGLFFASPAFAQQYNSRQMTFLHKRSLMLNIELDTANLINTKGIKGKWGVGFRLGVGHQLNDYLALDLNYQLTWIWIDSPDPVIQGNIISSNMAFSTGYARLIATYPRYWWQPYIFAGAGVYSFVFVDDKTGLSFPTNPEFPMGAGFNFYVWSNKLYLRTEFMYHLLIGETQDPAVLNLLGVSELSFDVFSLTFGAVFTLF